MDLCQSRILDPLIYGDYPPLMREILGTNLPSFGEDEVELVKGSVDFLGINHYTSFYAIDCLHSTDCPPTENRAIRGFVGRTIDRDGVPIGDEVHSCSFIQFICRL